MVNNSSERFRDIMSSYIYYAQRCIAPMESKNPQGNAADYLAFILSGNVHLPCSSLPRSTRP
jgi:hypothetical protein